MNATDNAFPAVQYTFHNGDTKLVVGGLTKREWFVGQALQGCAQSIHAIIQQDILAGHPVKAEHAAELMKVVMKVAIVMADETLKQLEEKKP